MWVGLTPLGRWHRPAAASLSEGVGGVPYIGDSVGDGDLQPGLNYRPQEELLLAKGRSNTGLTLR